MELGNEILGEHSYQVFGQVGVAGILRSYCKN
jgi:hypothetical protein